MKKILLSLSMISLFVLTGCATNKLTITKCKQYKDGICVVSKIEKVKQCKKPLVIDGKTYCKDK